MSYKKSTQRAQTLPSPKCQWKVIQDRINPDPNLDVCRIATKMLWIYCLFGISHFAKFRKKRRPTA